MRGAVGQGFMQRCFDFCTVLGKDALNAMKGMKMEGV